MQSLRTFGTRLERLKLQPAKGYRSADGPRGPWSGPRAADDPSRPQRDKEVASIRAGGQWGPIRRRAEPEARRSASSHMHTVPRAAHRPFPPCFPRLHRAVRLPRGGKVGAVGSRPQPPNHLFPARPSPAAGAPGLLPSRAAGLGRAPRSEPAARRAATLILGNSNSLRVGLGRTDILLPSPILGPLNTQALCSPRLGEGLGLG